MAKTDYQRIEKAITFLVDNADRQPSLSQAAAAVNLSPHHFQRLFCRWAGTSPKRFLQVLTLERGKPLLEESRSLLATAHAVGLSGGSRLHDHFVQLEAVTPGQYRNGGADLCIDYGEHASPFGPLFVAATPRGICRAGFLDHVSLQAQLEALGRTWPNARISNSPGRTSSLVTAMFGGRQRPREAPLSLQVAGTNFQIAVWRALLEIPEGAVVSYGDLADRLGRPGASRAIGNAVGANPVAFLIPCHRVIRDSGALGGYRWGAQKKQMIQAWERLRLAAN